MIAAIQAGGKSTRMGRDKAWVELDELPLISHCVQAVRSVASRVAVIVSVDTPDLDRYRQFCREGGLELVVDRYRSVGPLGGISTAIALAENDEPVLILACDLPFVSTEFLQRLCAFHEGAEVTAPLDEAGKIQMLCAIYIVSCGPKIDRMIEEGVYKVQELRSRVRVREISYEEYSGLENASRFLRNVNTPGDLA